MIKKYRIEHHKTQDQIAFEIGYSNCQFVSNWERGKSTPPANVLPKLIQVLKIPPKVLMEAVLEFQTRIYELKKIETQQFFKKLPKA